MRACKSFVCNEMHRVHKPVQHVWCKMCWKAVHENETNRVCEIVLRCRNQAHRPAEGPRFCEYPINAALDKAFGGPRLLMIATERPLASTFEPNPPGSIPGFRIKPRQAFIICGLSKPRRYLCRKPSPRNTSIC